MCVISHVSMSTWHSAFYIVILGPRLLTFCDPTSSRISESSVPNQHMGKNGEGTPLS